MALREQVFRGSRFWLVSSILVLVALVSVSILNPSTSYLPDARQVIYRYAEQLRVGHGLVFNADERTLLIPSPAYMLLLAFLAQVLSLNIITAAQVVFAVSLAFGVVYVFKLAQRLNLSIIPAVIIAAAYGLTWPLWAGVGTAFPVAAMLCLIAYDMALNDQWQFAGLILALAVLCTPTSALLALPLLVLAFNRNTAGTYLASLLVPLGISFIALYAYYGNSLLSGLLLFKDTARETSLFSNPAIIIALPILALAAWGWYKEKNNSVVALYGAAVAFYLAIVGGILRTDTSWRYTPIAALALLLAVVGLRNIAPLRKMLEIASIVILLVLIIPLLPTLAAPPFKPLSDPVLATAKSIGIDDTPTALSNLYFSSQSIIAFDGLLSPDLKTMLERDDKQSLLIRYAPDVIVGRSVKSELMTAPIMRLDYQSTDNGDIFIRKSEPGKFRTIDAKGQFGTDIRLVGAAVDQSTLKPGQMLRVRLDWQFARFASRPITVDLWLRDGDFLLAHSTDNYTDKDNIFIPGAWSTYHTLKVIDQAWSAPATLEVAVIVSDGVIARIPLTTLEVTEH